MCLCLRTLLADHCACRIKELADAEQDVDKKMAMRKIFRTLQGVNDEVGHTFRHTHTYTHASNICMLCIISIAYACGRIVHVRVCLCLCTCKIDCLFPWKYVTFLIVTRPAHHQLANAEVPYCMAGWV